MSDTQDTGKHWKLRLQYALCFWAITLKFPVCTDTQCLRLFFGFVVARHLVSIHPVLINKCQLNLHSAGIASATLAGDIAEQGSAFGLGFVRLGLVRPDLAQAMDALSHPALKA